MIYCNKGMGQIEGQQDELKAELSTVIRGLLEGGMSREDVAFSVMAGFRYKEVEADCYGTLNEIKEEAERRCRE